MNRGYSRSTLTRVKQCIKRYEMIPPGAHVVVGVSGGKDSTALLWIMAELQKRSHLTFTLEAVYLSLGWGEVDPTPLFELCRALEVRLTTIEHPVAAIIKGKPGHNPCALCSKLRAGVLNETAVKMGADCVALGHHLDDVIETYFLNLIYTGQMKTFMPRTYLSRRKLSLIRPLLYVPERALVRLGERLGLPRLYNPCPYDGVTKREDMKRFVGEMVGRYPDFREKFLTALENVDLDNLWLQRGDWGDLGGE